MVPVFGTVGTREAEEALGVNRETPCFCTFWSIAKLQEKAETPGR